MHVLDIYTNKRYSVINGQFIDLNRQYEQFAERIWIEELSEKSNRRLFRPVGGLKPNGLWYAFGRAWIDFSPKFKSNDNLVVDSHLTPVFELDLNTKKICKLNSQSQINAFDHYFKSRHGKNHINWAKVARQFDGIEIHEFDKSKSDLEWYCSFDISSGCIWNLNTINKYERVKLINDPNSIFKFGFGAI